MIFVKAVQRKYTLASTYPNTVSGAQLLEIFWSLTPDSEGGDRVERVISEIAGSWKLIDINLSELTFGASLVSGSQSQRMIKKYAAKAGEMPPIILDSFGDEYEIVDGYHRIAAANLRGDTKIKAYVPVG
jgi:hypothetical protein